MSNKRQHEKYDDDMTLEELEQELSIMFSDYDVEYPSETEVMKTIDTISQYVPVKETKWRKFSNFYTSLMKQAINETLYISILFWVVNGAFLITGLVSVLLIDIDPYFTILLLAPLPTIVGLIEVIKSKNSDMVELEMSFKYNFQEVILAKLFIVGGYNLIVNLIFTILVSSFIQDVLLWKLILHWILPFTVVTAISLLIINKIRSVYGITTSIVGWIAIVIAISQTKLAEAVQNVPLPLYVLLTIAAFSVIGFQMKRIYKRGVQFEINY